MVSLLTVFVFPATQLVQPAMMEAVATVPFVTRVLSDSLLCIACSHVQKATLQIQQIAHANFVIKIAKLASEQAQTNA